MDSTITTQEFIVQDIVLFVVHFILHTSNDLTYPHPFVARHSQRNQKKGRDVPHKRYRVRKS